MAIFALIGGKENKNIIDNLIEKKLIEKHIEVTRQTTLSYLLLKKKFNLIILHFLYLFYKKHY